MSESHSLQPARRLPLDARAAAVRRATGAAQDHLFSLQNDDGHWCGELEGDTILESEYALTMHFIGRTDDPKVRKAASYVRNRQLPSGGWSIFPGGPPEVSASVKAYAVLKLVGDSPESEPMRRARRAILEMGGIDACNSFTKLYLAIFGQYEWDRCCAVPPELVLLPRWFYMNIYEMSSWSRAIFIPLSIIWARKPFCPLPPHAAIPELRVANPPSQERTFWNALFLGIDRGVKLLERLPIKPSRDLAVKRAERWILQRLEDSDGLGAIFPPIINTIIALRSLDYPVDHPTVQGQVRELEKLEIEEGEELRVQPCFSPVWDTALSLNALVESGVDGQDPRILDAARWLLGKRGHASGDWSVKARKTSRPGWYFEYANPFYPDNDTTAMVVTALSKIAFPERADERHRITALREAHDWHVSMQNKDGGWAAFDKGCDKEILTHVPFADHNAMIDPSNEDITARILETFSCLGYGKSYPPARRALGYLLRHQHTDGSWYGRWGCNYLYGTWLALWGLESIGEETVGTPWARRAADWLAGCQNDDGGWGELPLSYEDATHKGRGPSTPSQTSWALMGLMAAGRVDDPATERGIDYLLREQHADGSWEEEFWTGTGFPGVFYLRYHLYRIYFPLLALATWGNRTTRDRDERRRSA